MREGLQPAYSSNPVALRGHDGREGHIPVHAEIWMRGDEWNLLVRAPEWVVDSFAKRGSMSNGRRVWVHNFGGGAGGYSFLLGTVEVEPPTRRERLARWLLRVPRRRFATH